MIDTVFSLGSPELWALINSFAYSITITLVRRGIATGTPLTSVIILNSCIAVAGLCTGFFRGSFAATDPRALLWFALTGMAGFGMGSLLFYSAIERLGVSRATVIHSATPLWGAVFAMIALGERPGSSVLLGTISIVGGICLLSWPEKEEKAGFRNWIQGGVYLPLISSVLFAGVPIFAKLGLSYQQTPYMGFGVAFTFGLLVILAARPLMPGGGVIQADRKAIWSFFLGAPANIIAAFSMWTALSRGLVSSVLPLSRMTPLWVLLLSYLFLGRYERIRPRTAIAAFLVVAGGVLITVFR
jgi:drug/metabolite transporter (DMT)-like permease